MQQTAGGAAHPRTADDGGAVVFTEKGHNDVLISDTAERAGVVEGSIHRFFTNKRDLLARVVEHWETRTCLRTTTSSSAKRPGGTWNRTRLHRRRRSRHHPPRARQLASLVSSRNCGPDPRYRQTRLFKLNQAYTHRLIEVVKEAVAQGEFRPDVSPALVRDMIYGCIEHRTWAFLRNEGDFDTDATADGITDVVFGGLVARKPEDEPMAKAISRMEDVAARLERLAGSQGD